MPALGMGAIAGVVCAFACGKIKGAFKYDDALDAFGVHGVGGTLGAILTGVFATRAAWDIGGGKPLGWLEAGSFGDSVMLGQLTAVGVTWVYSIVVTLVILGVVNVLVGLRVNQQEEIQGLDTTQHEEEGYIFA
jgi:Amt family ammonium transporter